MSGAADPANHAAEDDARIRSVSDSDASLPLGQAVGTSPSMKGWKAGDPDRRSVRRPRPKYWLVLVAMVLIVVVGLSAHVGRLYLRRQTIVYDAREAVPNIAATLPGAREITYKTSDGVTLRGWFLSPEAGTGSPPWPVALLFHGTGGSRAKSAPLAKQLAAQGIASFSAEYRGFADSDGVASEAGLRLDADAALETILRLPDVQRDRVVYVGHSLGAAVSIDLATRQPPHGLVAIAPFTNLVDALSNSQYRVLAKMIAGRDRYANDRAIRDVHVPVFVVRSATDGVVRPQQSIRVFDAANEPKRMIVVRNGATHADPRLTAGEEVVTAVVTAAKDLPDAPL